MRAKFNGTCKGCGGSIQKGSEIRFKPGMGATHSGCDFKIDGKSLEQKAMEWDSEHAGEPTALDRFEEMRVSRDYADVPEDAILQYAREDTPSNPYRGKTY